jgi:hypothetical protein
MTDVEIRLLKLFLLFSLAVFFIVGCIVLVSRSSSDVIGIARCTIVSLLLGYGYVNFQTFI